MTQYDITLTPGVDDDQTAAAQAQINAVPNGTSGNPNVINMPAGRYRMQNGLKIQNKSHIRWTCLDGVEVYPNVPDDSEAFVAYSTATAAELTGHHFQINNCLDVVGSFFRVEGPHTALSPSYPLYSAYSGSRENEHGFSLFKSNVDCGWEDCSWYQVGGDGFNASGFLSSGFDANIDCWATRISGQYCGRHAMSIGNVEGFVGTDVTGEWCGFCVVDIEPNAQYEHAVDVELIRVRGSNAIGFPFSLTGGSTTHPSKQRITLVDCEVIANAKPTFAGVYTRNEAEDLVIEGFTDDRGSGTYGMDLGGPWDNVTVRDCFVRHRSTNSEATYALSIWATDSLVIEGNTFNGVTEGWDNLYRASGLPTPTSYVHWGNVWAMGTQNDGTTPPFIDGSIVSGLPSLDTTATGNVGELPAAPTVAVGGFSAIYGSAGALYGGIILGAAQVFVADLGSLGSTLPALTQDIAGDLSDDGSIAQVLPALDQIAYAGVVASGSIVGSATAMALPALTQDIDATATAEAVVASGLPALEQAASGGIPIGGSIAQTLPALDTAARTIIVRWPEWSVSSGAEWAASDGEEWDVSTDDEWLVRA